MKIDKIHLICFSATGATQSALKSIASGFSNAPVAWHNITHDPDQEVQVAGNELAIFGVPVYSGRIPAAAAKALKNFRGNATPAIAAVVYGNRAYDDALLELKNTVEGNSFKVVAAGAFVAEHSIFPAVANGRPDAQDLAALQEFGQKSRALLDACESVPSLPGVTVRGSFPYRDVKPIPLKPKGSRRCTGCGTCVKGCPAHAIAKENPRKTNRHLCTSCARCIKLCPESARHFGGILYRLAGKKFVSKFGGVRKEAEVFFGS